MNDETLKLDIIKAGGYAYSQFNIDPWGHSRVTGGMTLRDYFAAQWMNGFVANPESADLAVKKAAEKAYLIADAMLAERVK